MAGVVAMYAVVAAGILGHRVWQARHHGWRAVAATALVVPMLAGAVIRAGAAVAGVITGVYRSPGVVHVEHLPGRSPLRDRNPGGLDVAPGPAIGPVVPGRSVALHHVAGTRHSAAASRTTPHRALGNAAVTLTIALITTVVVGVSVVAPVASQLVAATMLAASLVASWLAGSPLRRSGALAGGGIGVGAGVVGLE
jgi:hypothetical protein